MEDIGPDLAQHQTTYPEIEDSIGTTYPDLNIEDKVQVEERDIYMYIDQDQDATIADQVNSQEQIEKEASMLRVYQARKLTNQLHLYGSKLCSTDSDKDSNIFDTCNLHNISKIKDTRIIYYIIMNNIY